MKFNELQIDNRIKTAIAEKGYTNLTPIQQATMNTILEGKDVLACAQTGTGKTAAFAIPLLEKLVMTKTTTERKIKVLVLTPTRELAIQIRDNFRDYGKNTGLKCSVIFGGVNQKSQIEVLKKGVDILVATPGRLLDLINQKRAKLQDVDYLVLDEADRMLDMGFIHDVRRVVSHVPKKRQTLLFSATMPKSIEVLANEFLVHPEKIIVTPPASTVEKITQQLYYVDKVNKAKLLIELIKKETMESTLIFTRTKYGADKLVKKLKAAGIKSAAIHGDKSQNARVRALDEFKERKINILIATDIAARGIDIDSLSHVINYEIPEVAETYVHRIGRTARAGKEGIAISLCDFTEQKRIKEIEKLTKQSLIVISKHSYPLQDRTIVKKVASPKRKK